MAVRRAAATARRGRRRSAPTHNPCADRYRHGKGASGGLPPAQRAKSHQPCATTAAVASSGGHPTPRWGRQPPPPRHQQRPAGWPRTGPPPTAGATGPECDREAPRQTPPRPRPPTAVVAVAARSGPWLPPPHLGRDGLLGLRWRWLQRAPAVARPRHERPPRPRPSPGQAARMEEPARATVHGRWQPDGVA